MMSRSGQCRVASAPGAVDAPAWADDVWALEVALP
jgi:hypothetical protein